MLPTCPGKSVATSIVSVVMIRYLLPRRPLMSARTKFDVGITAPRRSAMFTETATMTRDRAMQKAMSLRETCFGFQNVAAPPSSPSLVWASISSMSGCLYFLRKNFDPAAAISAKK